MGNEDNRESEEFEEFNERKEGSGQTPTTRNPRGAGRPSDEWREYQEFKEWKAARDAGVIPRDISEILRGLVDSGERRGDRDSDTDAKGLLAQLGEMMKISKKDIDKLGLADEQIKQITKFTAPYLLPKLLGIAGLIAGAIGLYKVEELKKTVFFTQEEWDKLSDNQKSIYLRIWKPIPLDTEDERKIKAIRYRMPYRPLHKSVEMLRKIFGAIDAIIEGEWGVFSLLEQTFSKKVTDEEKEEEKTDE